MDKRFQLIYREDGRIELACEHGVGHTIIIPNIKIKREKKWDDKGYYTLKETRSAWFTHGCDGCCGRPEFKKEEKRIKKDFKVKL